MADIVAASPTPSDLVNFIYASLALYCCFLAKKQSILLSFAARRLGPAIRDALVLVRTEHLYWRDDEYYDKFFDVLRECGQRLARSPPRPWGVDAAIVVPIAQHGRATRFFVDLYESTWLSLLRDIDTAIATPLSLSDRGRMSLALTRRQVLMRLYPQRNLAVITRESEKLLIDRASPSSAPGR